MKDFSIKQKLKITCSYNFKNRKKFFIQRKNLIRIIQNSVYFRNLKKYICRVAIKKQIRETNSYILGAIQGFEPVKKHYSLDNLFFGQKIHILFEGKRRAFPINVISDQFPTIEEKFGFAEYVIRKNAIIKFKQFFSNRKERGQHLAKKRECFFFNIKLCGSKIFE